MNRFTLPRTDKNIVYDRILELKLEPSEFQWTEERSEYSQSMLISVLTHRPSGYYFKFDCTQIGGLVVKHSPGLGKPITEIVERGWRFPGVEVRTWLQALKIEIETPDLWEAISQERDLITLGADQSSNRAFTTDEQTQVARCLYEIKSYLNTSQQLSEQDRREVNARFDYLEGAATRVGKKDWTILLVGTLLNICITLALPGTNAAEVFRFAAQAVRQFLGGILYLPTIH